MSANAAVGFLRPVLTVRPVLTAHPVPTGGMTGAVAKWYVALTKETLEDFAVLARRIAEKIPARARVLEVAPGPGHFAIELAKLTGYKIAGLDPSEASVAAARANAAIAGVPVDFRRCSTSSMPFDGAAFDFIICRAPLKSFADPRRALEEIHRVLHPGGRALIFDLRKDASGHAVNGSLSSVTGIVTKLPFRFMQLKRAYTKSELQELISDTKSHPAEIRENENLPELAVA
jgi:ubiquinone/menaquinone biosynthesis C-methylase UbiE